MVSTVAGTVAMGEVWLGIEGAALLRAVVEGDDAFVAARLDAIRALVDQCGAGPFDLRAPVPELDVEEGYRAWAPRYDEMSNALIRAEGPLVAAVLDEVPPGVALDAAFGTGRLTALLAARGHHTHGLYLRAFRSAGLEALDCVEEPMQADFTQGLTTGAPEAAEALWRGVPVALVWSVERRCRRHVVPRVNTRRSGAVGSKEAVADMGNRTGQTAQAPGAPEPAG